MKGHLVCFVATPCHTGPCQNVTHQALSHRWKKPHKQYICHDDVIKWKHFPRYWPFVRRIHRSRVNSPHKGQWRGALMFPLICAWIDGCLNGEAGDWRRHRANYDDVMLRCIIQRYHYAINLLVPYFISISTVLINRMVAWHTWNAQTVLLNVIFSLQ